MSATAPARSPLERLKEILAELADLGHAEQILDWDARVSMPRGGANARADVAATLAEFSHQRFVTDEMGELLERLEADEDPDSADGALVRVTRREWENTEYLVSERQVLIRHGIFQPSLTQFSLHGLPNTTVEMYGTDKSGEEMKMMEIVAKRK